MEESKWNPEIWILVDYHGCWNIRECLMPLMNLMHGKKHWILGSFSLGFYKTLFQCTRKLYFFEIPLKAKKKQETD